MLAELSELRNLDISDEREEGGQEHVLAPGARWRVASLLQRPALLPKLQQFDISGKEEIVMPGLVAFLGLHPELCFLGLVLTEACRDPVFRDANNPEFRNSLATSGIR